MTDIGDNFLEWVQQKYAKARFGGEDGYNGVTHVGLALLAANTGRVLVSQRAPDPTDTADVAETWEFPGGGLNTGEDALAGAMREFDEEIGGDISAGVVTNGWRSPNGLYQGFVVEIPAEMATDEFEGNDEVQAIQWIAPEDATSLNLRPEMADMDWSLLTVSGNEDDMDDTTTDQSDDVAASDDTEPEWDAAAFVVQPIPIHGILAPEEAETGDQRGFNAGSMTQRPTTLPFSWQESAIGGHDGSVVTGGLDRLMRKDGMIHFEGSLMPAPGTDPFVGLLAFFGQYGVSVDGDSGSLDMDKSLATGVAWFDAVRASGLTAVHIPAFHQAYVAFGMNDEMPGADDETLTASMTLNNDLVSFGRGPGYVTNPVATNRLHDYWTKPGQAGYAKVGWGTPGDFARAKALIGAKIAENSPDTLRYLNQIIAQWHFDALGYWPATHAKMDRAGVKASNDADADKAGAWEAVLTSSGGDRVLPPLGYFARHPNTGATVIEEPDANGIRRTYGYAAERGVCHIGYAGECVEAPFDEDSVYPEFHLGRTKTDEGYINTGLITYGIAHRDADEILSETATQAHFDDLSHAWAAVRCGTDDRGMWFSGVVLPTVEEKWLTAIEASGQVSGEWKYGAIRTLLTVNVPGFPVIRSSAVTTEDGEVLALVASAHGEPYKIAEPAPDEFCSMSCGEVATWGVWESPSLCALYCDTHYAEADTSVDWQCPDDTEALAAYMAVLGEDF